MAGVILRGRRSRCSGCGAAQRIGRAAPDLLSTVLLDQFRRVNSTCTGSDSAARKRFHRVPYAEPESGSANGMMTTGLPPRSQQSSGQPRQGRRNDQYRKPDPDDQ